MYKKMLFSDYLSFFKDSSWERWGASWEHPRWFCHRPEPKYYFLYCMPPW